jgi:peptide deformylase
VLKIITDEKKLRQSTENVNDMKTISDIVSKLILVGKKLSIGYIGLAANQIGINKRVCILKFGNKINWIINPEIIKKSEKETEFPEGCFSIPKTLKDRIKINRPKSVKVKYTNENNETVIQKFTGTLSRAIQHEIDHLDGVLITDYIGGV